MFKTVHSPKQQRLIQLLRQVRIEADLSQSEVARRLKVPQSLVSKYESGDRRLDLVELEKVCEAAGITLAEFIRRYQAGATDEYPEKSESSFTVA
ncbi:MAG: helix-turn-helix domain-containing protein [Janthinobacterium lividum]